MEPQKPAWKGVNQDQGASGSKSGRGNNSKRPTLKTHPCWICGQLGHCAEACSKRREPAIMVAGVIKTVFCCPVVSSPQIHITAEVDGKQVHCLLDSGCKRSVISRKLVPDLCLTPSCYALSMANKMDLPIIGDVDFNFTVDRPKFKTNVSISHYIDQFLLGSDWLVTNNVKWDFTEGTIGDKVICVV